MNLDACQFNRWEMLRRELNNLHQQHFRKLQQELPDAVVSDVENSCRI